VSLPLCLNVEKQIQTLTAQPAAAICSPPPLFSAELRIVVSSDSH